MTGSGGGAGSSPLPHTHQFFDLNDFYKQPAMTTLKTNQASFATPSRRFAEGRVARLEANVAALRAKIARIQRNRPLLPNCVSFYAPLLECVLACRSCLLVPGTDEANLVDTVTGKVTKMPLSQSEVGEWERRVKFFASIPLDASLTSLRAAARVTGESPATLSRHLIAFQKGGILGLAPHKFSPKRRQG